MQMWCLHARFGNLTWDVRCPKIIWRQFERKWSNKDDYYQC